MNFHFQKSADSLGRSAGSTVFLAFVWVMGGEPARAQTSSAGDPANRPFLVGNGVQSARPYSCDLEFARELSNKRPWPFPNLDVLYYPHRVQGLDAEYPQNIAFIATNLLPYSPGLIFSGATVQHGDVTFRPEDGPDNLGLAQPFNRHSISRQVRLLNEHDVTPARHLSLSGMILEELPAGARDGDWYLGIKKKAAGQIAPGHTMVNPKYANPAVRSYLADTFAILAGSAGYHYFWMDNWFDSGSIYPLVYQAVRNGVERNGGWAILRSGAGPSQVGLTDILAPPPDVQHAWQYVAEIFTNRVIVPYVRYCPNAFKQGFDDIYIKEPFTRDQARFLATLYAIPGMEITITEGEFFKTPAERVQLLQQILPLPITGPLQMTPPVGSHIWVESLRRPFEAWHVAAFMNESVFRPRNLVLNFYDLDVPDRPLLAWDFWDHRFLGVFKDQLAVRLGPASCLVAALRPLEDHPQFLSSDRHILQGAEELSDLCWDAGAGSLSGQFTRGVSGKSFSIYLHVPANWHFLRASDGIERVENSGSEILKATLVPKANSFHWMLDFRRAGPSTSTDLVVTSVTNVVGELVTGTAAFPESWKSNGAERSITAIIPARWKSGRVRVVFTRSKVSSVAVNGVDCPLVTDPARRFTAWYTNESECAFLIPSSAVHWDQTNRVTALPENLNAGFPSGTTGLQLDLSQDRF